MNDKILHFIAGASIAFGFWFVTRDFDTFAFAPALISIATGFSKEMINVFRKNYFSWLDLLATFAGGLITNMFILFL